MFCDEDVFIFDSCPFTVQQLVLSKWHIATTKQGKETTMNPAMCRLWLAIAYATCWIGLAIVCPEKTSELTPIYSMNSVWVIFYVSGIIKLWLAIGMIFLMFGLSYALTFLI